MTKQELIDFLFTVDKRHINELIDILTDFEDGRNALNATVKDVLKFGKMQNHAFTKKEIELLITEFQAFGGNTIANVFRNKDSFVSYSEILNDVFMSSLNSTVQLPKLTDKEKEEVIVFQLFGNNWASASFKERYDKSKTMKISIGNTENQTINLLPKAIHMALGAVAPAVVGAATLNEVTASPATRITKPFIVQIAWLKMKYQTAKETHLSTMQGNTEVLAINDNNQSILSLREYAEQPEIKNDFSKQDIAMFNQLFSNIPAVATKYETIKNHIVSINIDPSKLTKAKDGDGWRAFTMGRNKKGHFGITENARIYDGKQLKQMVNANLLINAASTIVAQQHLADINEKLKEIQTTLEEIKGFLNDERRSKIYAAINNIKFNSTQLIKLKQKDESIPETEIHSLIQQCTDNLAVKQHLETDLRKTATEIQNIKLNSFAGKNNDKDLKKMQQKIQQWQEHYQEHQLCCNVILMTYGILYNISKNETDAQHYADKAEHLVQEVTQFYNHLIPDIKAHFPIAQNNAKGVTNFDSTDLAQAAFFEKNIAIFEKLESEIKHKLQNTLSINKLKPITVAFRLENGTITEGQIVD